MSIEIFLFTILVGIVPPLIWLWFWLKEDKLHPEPRKILIRAFVAGMVTVPLVLPFQKYIFVNLSFYPFLLTLFYAGIEEIFKLIASWSVALRRKECNEPIDAMIYLITTALGFAAVENLFFLLNPGGAFEIEKIVITGSFRFMGAALLHLVASGFIGVTLAFSFYRKKKTRALFVTCGLIGAIVLHTSFNLLIIYNKNYLAFTAFIVVWIAVVALMLVFEKVKKI